MKNIFSNEQESTISLYLEKGISPLKFAYMTEKGAESWSILESKRAERGGNYAEYELLINNILIYLQELGNPKELAIFDFGCGTGDTVKGMLLELQGIGINVHYHAFDMSQEIIHYCKQNIGNIGKNYSFDSTILDFETFNLTNILIEIRKKYNNIPVLGLLLGNTIGNFESMERVITNIVDAFRIQDKLVIGIEKVDISNEKRKLEVIKGYQDITGFNLTFSTLEYFGVNRGSGKSNIIFNTNNSSIEVYFEFNEDVTINIDNNKIVFYKGDRIRLAQSKKINEANFAELFLNLDLRIVNMRTNEKNTFIQIMISPRKY